ncbi:MAG TPA: phenylalanine--tRNA ligase subunit beta [Pyrinomonadaceae bacterium]|nr:phenylalanine--tRNA ligase subunit beta [Pyrinomonadaceae bacterium]
MLISYNWLRELTGTKLGPQEVRERLTNVGLAIDAVEERGDDYVLDVEVPSNRGDCLSHVGIARELAVIEKSQISNLKFEIKNKEGKTTELTAVEILDPDLCPRYAARVVRQVKIGPSPDWLVKKLEAIGQRPINNVADITNYVLHELGQPLHAFDLAKLTDHRIVVRRAAKDEIIKTLDGIERKLDGEMLVIADAKRPVAVAGVMGGEDSEISNTTTDVLIESAYFNPASVRRTARLLGLHTEASHRFERGTDPEGVLRAQERCVALICEIAGGVATDDALDVYARPSGGKSASLRPARVEVLTGLRVETEEVLRILSALGFELFNESSEHLIVNIPTWRHDVAIEEDLIEEVARHTGFDKIKTALPPASLAGEYHSSERRKRALRQALSALGYNEAISLSFIDAALDDQFELIPAFAVAGGQPEKFVTLRNPIIEDWKRMRPTLLPGLLNAVRHNLNQGTRDVSLFELGRVFRAGKPGELPDEREALTLAATGGVLEADKAGASRDFDFYDLKGALDTAREALKLPALDYHAAEVKHLRAGQSAAVSINGIRVGSIGRLAEAAAGIHKFRQPVFVAEIDLTALLEIKELPVLYARLPRFPSVVRDVSLLVDRQVTVAELILAANIQKVENCVGVMFVGVYEGEGIPEGKRSVTLSFEYRASDRTLRDEEVDELHWPLVKGLQEKFAAEVR